MLRLRVPLIVSVLSLAGWVPVTAQTVISTHSGVLYFFEGTVTLAGERLEQKFGRFPDLGEGRELRTGQGRAEVLLTPGVFLRIGDNSAIRMISDQLADTRVELLDGSAIMEVNQLTPDTAVTLIYKQWQVHAPQRGVYRIDSDPAQLRVYKGEAQISTADKAGPVTVTDGQSLPLASVLVPEQTSSIDTDGFKTWAMNRSQAVSADNAIASEIVDDPNQIDSSGMSLGGFNYFPITGVPSLGINNPYGVSFWSPYQASLNSLYFSSPYLYGPYYGGWPTQILIYPRAGYPLRPGTGIGLHPGFGGVGLRPGLGGIGLRPGVGTIGLHPGLINPRPAMTMPRPAVVRPMSPARVGGRR
jgi:hypothetical protein